MQKRVGLCSGIAQVYGYDKASDVVARDLVAVVCGNVELRDGDTGGYGGVVDRVLIAVGTVDNEGSGGGIALEHFDVFLKAKILFLHIRCVRNANVADALRISADTRLLASRNPSRRRQDTTTMLLVLFSQTTTAHQLPLTRELSA